MLNNKLADNLKSLQNIKPDLAWKERNREILVAQVFGSNIEILVPRENVLNNLARFFSLHFIQAWSALAVLVVLLGGAFGVNASRDTKPGDTLYVAKKISEKARAAVVFDKKAQLRLGLEFAENRVEEIKLVNDDANKEGNAVAKKEQAREDVRGLSRDFKNQIEQAKKKVVEIKPDLKDAPKKEVAAKPTKEQARVKAAQIAKEDKGIEIAETQTTGEILSQAKEALNKEDYNSALELLDKAAQNIDKEAEVDNGEVKGVKENVEENEVKTQESATSTK